MHDHLCICYCTKFNFCIIQFHYKIAHKNQYNRAFKDSTNIRTTKRTPRRNRLTLSKSQTAVLPQRTNPVKLLLTPVPCIFYYCVQWPTNAYLTDKLLRCSYVFRRYCVIFRELVVSTLLSCVASNETRHAARPTLWLGTRRASMMTASTYRLYIWPPHRTSWGL